ncbi:hypothetical protein [Streptomyces oryzae]|uniref:hypothetical protein n=1 Tax=Streptomyces oryzae TaxID=1434886 RepID=UPI001FFE2B8A|nr:hypothetical protein [Streptomyces oryzae]
MIALGPDGTFDAPHSSPGMLYGYLTKYGEITTRIFPDESPANSSPGWTTWRWLRALTSDTSARPGADPVAGGE